MEKSKLKVVDLFAGCGGMALGFQNAGFEVVGAFEYWDKAAACHAANFKHPVFQDDLSDVENAITIIRALSPDVITGGPPCQDFSNAGNGIEGERAALTVAYAEIIAAVAPKCFIMENVPKARKSKAYAAARKLFKDAGYGLTEVVINAALCGVPQKRKRFFCFGSLGVDDNFLTAYITNSLSETEMTVRDYFGDALAYEYYSFKQRNGVRRAIYSIDEPAATVRGVNGNLPKDYKGHPSDACAYTPNIHAITTAERAQIQTFPADFKWTGCKTATDKMIGNAVPVKLAEFVAKALMHHITTETHKVSISSANKSAPQRIGIEHGGGEAMTATVAAATTDTYESVEDLAFLHCQFNMNERAYAAKLIPQPVYEFAKNELRKSIEQLSRVCYNFV